MIYIILFVASSFIFHEIGHGAALDKFGHNPGRLGVGVFLIYPVFFTEFLTIELMPPGDRFWVNISGSYFQLLFANILMLTVLTMDNVAWAIIAAWMIYGAAAVQMIPINKSDGYWLVHDALIAAGLRKLIIWFQRGSNALILALLVSIVTRAIFTLIDLFDRAANSRSDTSILISFFKRDWMTGIVLMATVFLLTRLMIARVKRQRVRRGASNFRGTSTGV